MRNKKLYIFLLGVFTVLCCSTRVAAQSKQPLETKEMYFRILSVQKISTDSVVAVIDGGKIYGVQIGSAGLIKANNKFKDERSLIELGFCSVVKVNDTTSLLSIKAIDNTGTKAGYDIRKGDYAKLNIKVPVLPYHSLFFEFALLDCQFTNLNKMPLYAFEYLIYNDSKKIEDSILNAAAADVVATYESLKNMDSTYNGLRAPLTEGRYKGKSVFEVMANCTARDIAAFLNYAINYSNNYMGNTFKVNETFATWVMNKAHYSKKEMYDSVRANVKTPLLLQKFIEKNIDRIKSESFVNEWISEAVQAAFDGKMADATEIFETAKILLPYLQLDCTTGYYFYGLSTLTDKKKDYKSSLAVCDSAYNYFVKCSNDYFKVQTLFRKWGVYINMDKDDEGLVILEKINILLVDPNSKLKPSEKTTFTGKSSRFAAAIYSDKGELKKAAAFYIKAIDAYQSLGDYENIKFAANLQLKLAGIYKKQSEFVKALEIYNNQLEIYNKLNDKKNVADVLDNIGSVHFSLGNYRKVIDFFTDAKLLHLFFNEYDDAGYSESNIGQAYWNLGLYDSAIHAHNTALSYKRQANSNAGQAYSWKKLGGLYKLTGEKTKALLAYDSSANYYTLANDSSNLKDLLNDVGDVYLKDKQYQKAFTYYSRVHDINVKKTDKSELVNSLYNLGNASFYFSIDTSKKYFTNSYNLAKEIGDKSNELSAGLNLGILCFKVYDYPLGEKYFTNALIVAKSEKNKSQEANCYKLIAAANAGNLDFDKAINFYQKAIFLYDSLGEKSALPEVYKNVGNTFYTKGDFTQSRKWLQKSIELAYSINSRADVGYAYNAITFLYSIQGELSKAQAAADSAYSIFKDLNNSWQMADAYFNKGVVAEAKSDGISAFRFYSLADSIYKIEKDYYGHSTCQTNMGCVYYYQADFDNALKYFKEADSTLSTVNVITEGHLLAPANIGAAYYYKKEYATAEKYLLDSYKKSKERKVNRIINIASNFLGMTYYETKKYTEAEKYLLESYQLSQQMNESDMVIQAGMSLGRLYIAQNDLAKGNDYLSRTVAYTKNIENTKYAWEVLYEYGLSFYNQKNFDSATSYFKQAVQIVENASQNLFGGAEAKKLYNADYRKVDLYNKLIASLAKGGKKEDAFYYANKSNSQAVKEQMEKAGLVTNDKDKAEAIKKGGELLQKKNAVDQAIIKERSKPEKEQNKELIASLESVKNVAEVDYTNFIEQLQRKYPDLQSYFSNTNPKDFKNYIEDIPDSTIVALYVVNDNQLYIFTVTNKETSIKTIELKQDINKQAAKFLSILRNPNNATGTGAVTLRSTLKPVDDVRGDFKAEATDLYNLLITPIADQLKDKKNICVITNGKLGSIPFQCLGIKDDKNNFHFLVEDYAIFYTSKIDIFRKSYKNRKMQSSLAVFGNPDKSLPGATEEANEIAKIIPTATVYIEGNATEAKAKESLQNYNYIHFATHGVLDYTNFENSYLLFAADAGANDDGKLTIKEINGLTKQTNSMVVLSACETAVSKEEVKGWYISPANAFLTNRVDAVLGSLWKVPDETTNILLQEFYINIEKKGMTKAEALRHAQAAVSKNPKYSHPFFWSAFVLYGEWR